MRRKGNLCSLGAKHPGFKPPFFFFIVGNHFKFKPIEHVIFIQTTGTRKHWKQSQSCSLCLDDSVQNSITAWQQTHFRGAGGKVNEKLN